jgi:hypothetical protein
MGDLTHGFPSREESMELGKGPKLGFISSWYDPSLWRKMRVVKRLSNLPTIFLSLSFELILL